MHKKSQIQIGETIAVLFVFFILIGIGFIFYAKFIRENVEEEKEEFFQQRSIGIAQRVMFLPELQCSEDIVKEIKNCIDVLKLESAADIIKRKENEVYYYDLLEFSKITLTQVYPLNPLISDLEIYNRENFENKFLTNVPISLYNAITKKYAFGILTIETTSK